MNKEKILSIFPIFVQNILVTFFNFLQYRKRRGSYYNHFRSYFEKIDHMNEDEWKAEQAKRVEEFLNYVTQKSLWYENYKGKNIQDFPILSKDDIKNNLDTIKTLPERKGIVSKTGGTTGKSMKVIYNKIDMQERHALLDHFREKHGYKLGMKTAWFSGKHITSEKDIEKGYCYRDDYINKIRFFSAFHINEENFESYWKALNSFSPKFIVGYPSSIFKLAEIARAKNLKYEGKIEVFFPTAETLHEYQREIIYSIFGCRIYDQYASSEGAPFILECEFGKMHIHPLSGLFEFISENNEEEKNLIVTSFTTRGTPLVRYDIKDKVIISNQRKCKCGSSFQIVDKIIGRANDYILTTSKGKVYMINLVGAGKGLKGLESFQLEQYFVNEVKVNLMTSELFTKIEENSLIKELLLRLGKDVKITMNYVDSISTETSGKFRFIKNHLAK